MNESFVISGALNGVLRIRSRSVGGVEVEILLLDVHILLGGAQVGNADDMILSSSLNLTFTMRESRRQ